MQRFSASVFTLFSTLFTTLFCCFLAGVFLIGTPLSSAPPAKVSPKKPVTAKGKTAKPKPKKKWKPKPEQITPEQTTKMKQEIARLKKELAKLPQKWNNYDYLDAAICVKGAEWTLRHNQFFRKGYIDQTFKVLKLAQSRIDAITQKKTPHWQEAGKQHACAYQSKVDGSIQPYSISLPANFDIKSGEKLSLHVVLHGYNKRLNEPTFIMFRDGKQTPLEQTWVQLDVYGRGNNGYRWAGEADVFEAIQDVERRLNINKSRISIWGFSMGGAGTWHLGLHYPSSWASAGAGAGFVDFYKYQKKTERLPHYQHKTLKIYDSINYAHNNINLPLVAYCGELDKGMANTQMMITAGKKNNSPFKLIVGKNIGHKFTPEGKKEFIAFLKQHSDKRLPTFERRPATKVHFTTYTPKYNECEWVVVEELIKMYQKATFQGDIDTEKSFLTIKTENVRAFQIDRSTASSVSINGGKPIDLEEAADGLLSSVYFRYNGKNWNVLSYEDSRSFEKNPGLHKRKNFQGPIDDAFMQPFLCVEGTGTPWSTTHQKWTQFTLKRFQNEYDKWLRAEVPLITDKELTDKQIAQKNIVLFGDPGSNSVLAKVVKDLPIKWTKESIEVAGKSYPLKNHGLSLVFPNPLNPDRYVVINSGHTMHEKDFRGSNSNLYPRLGDIAIQKFSEELAHKKKESFEEETVWAEVFDTNWELPAAISQDNKADQ